MNTSLSLYPPATTLHGSFRPGGSKSISNRLLILQALSGSNTKFHNLSESEDSLLLKKALELIKTQKEAKLHVGHAGTDFRFLCGLLSVTEGHWLLDGSSRLRERPIKELVNALRELGADIRYTEKEGFAPLVIKGKRIKGGAVRIPAGISSQFISALLLSAAAFENGLDLTLEGPVVSSPYIIMTIELMKVLDYSVQHHGNNIVVRHGIPVQSLSDYTIESDWSSASYAYSCCALSPGSSLRIKGLYPQSLQADSKAQDLFRKLGVQSVFEKDDLLIQQQGTAPTRTAADFTECPDLAPAYVCTCAGLGVEARLTGLQTLQNKESHRINTLGHELEKLGHVVETGSDYLHLIPTPAQPKTMPLIETHQDHRIAMAFAPLALHHPGIGIKSPEVVNKSYPGFWRDLQSLGFNLTLRP